MGAESQGILGQLQENAELERRDPWELPSSYFPVTYRLQKSTPSGFWKEIQGAHTSIFSEEWSSHSYFGWRKTLAFYQKDGTKTDWLMHQYYFYRGVQPYFLKPGYYRKVFKEDTYQPASWYHANNVGHPSEVTELYDMTVDGAMLAQADPWRLPPYYIMKKNLLCSQRTHSGFWEEKENDLIAVRSPESSSTTTKPPSYQGVRRTFEFTLNDGTKTDWVIHEYLHLHNKCSGAVTFVQDNLVIRKVFRKGTTHHQDNSRYRSTEKYLEACEEACSRGEAVNDTRSLRDLGTKSLDDISFFRWKIQSLQDCELRSLSEIQTTTTADPYERADNVRQHFTKIHTNDSDGKSDNVWKHFTKICSANDPDEVYAACHHCDRVLKAHPKKHGTSQLRRHMKIHKSGKGCSNPSTDEDRKMLHCLRTVQDSLYGQQNMDEMLAFQEHVTQLDPWDLNLTGTGITPWYVTRSLNRQTHGGFWKEINKGFTAIRMEQPQMQECWKKPTAIQMMDDLLKMHVPQYMGLRTALEFHSQDSNKTDWIMFEYQQVDDNKSPALFLQGDMVIRKVFRYDKDAVSSAELESLDRWLNGDDNDEDYFNGEGVNTDTTTPSDYMDTPCSVFPLDEGMNTDTTTSSSDYMDIPVDRKRKRTGAASRHKSPVWMYFTKIYNTDHGLVYVVCHSCDKGYTSGSSKNGTSHLSRHSKKCSSKRPGTANVNNGANAAWEAEIRPLFLLLKNYGETEH